MRQVDKRKAEIKRIMIEAHPEWAGRIWIYKYSIGIRGFKSGSFFWPEFETPEEEAKAFIELFEDEEPPQYDEAYWEEWRKNYKETIKKSYLAALEQSCGGPVRDLATEDQTEIP